MREFSWEGTGIWLENLMGMVAKMSSVGNGMGMGIAARKRESNGNLKPIHADL